MNLSNIRREIQKLQADVAERTQGKVEPLDMSPMEIARRVAFIFNRAKVPLATEADQTAAARIRELLGAELSGMFDRWMAAAWSYSEPVPAH